MKEISIVQNKVFGHDWIILRERLGDHLCNWYSMASPKQKRANYVSSIVLTSFPYYAWRITNLLIRMHLLPRYYGWWVKQWATDVFISKKVARDESKIVFCLAVHKHTITKCTRKGKTVVIFAANSEPMREHERVMADYELFGIKKRYIYGDLKYESILADMTRMASKMINITEVSQKTFADAGYDMSKSHVILDTGCNYERQYESHNGGGKRAFITTAFHSFVKGTHRLLLAWRKAGIKDIPLYVVGGICEDMDEFIKKYGPFDNVFFEGARYDLKEWYKQFDAVGITLSLSEGSGRVTPEMMTFGFPMIVSKDATCDLVKDGFNGSVVEATNEDEIVNALRYYAEDWTRVIELRANVLKSVGTRTCEEFNIEIADYLISLIDEKTTI